MSSCVFSLTLKYKTIWNVVLFFSHLWPTFDHVSVQVGAGKRSWLGASCRLLTGWGKVTSWSCDYRARILERVMGGKIDSWNWVGMKDGIESAICPIKCKFLKLGSTSFSGLPYSLLKNQFKRWNWFSHRIDSVESMPGRTLIVFSKIWMSSRTKTISWKYIFFLKVFFPSKSPCKTVLIIFSLQLLEIHYHMREGRDGRGYLLRGWGCLWPSSTGTGPSQKGLKP